jgi:NCAIR mutase (PurE)-related protein
MKDMLEEYKAGKIPLQIILKRIEKMPYEDLGFAKIDNHRIVRKGFPETIYCKGKKISQILEILRAMNVDKHNILATKASKKVYSAVKKEFSNSVYHETARTIVIQNQEIKHKKGNILIITAGTSDIPIAEEAVVTAEFMGNTVEKAYDVGVAGIHRLLDIKEKMDEATVIIVVAGMEGALASLVAGLTSKPVIAVPTSVGYGASFKGIAPLLTMMNSCAEGIVVVNIDNGFGAGYFASLINR